MSPPQKVSDTPPEFCRLPLRAIELGSAGSCRLLADVQSDQDLHPSCCAGCSLSTARDEVGGRKDLPRVSTEGSGVAQA